MATVEGTALPVHESAPPPFPTQPSQETLPPKLVNTVQDETAPKTPNGDNDHGFVEPATPKTEPSPTHPDEAATAKESNKRSHLDRGDSQRSEISNNSGDVDMEDDDDLDDGSDNESVDSGSNRPSKKKKGQRFFCTDYPPCKLSFTRSEHLARHIRKHTGERPFQCHCLRKFSRLDNLRQHAQTVHVNEEIPGDSLAATGTRFQRQIRTDRMRTPGNRNRAATIGSQPPYSRGHSRNVSGSSIGSIPSDIGSPETARRPQPLAPSTPRGSISVDTYSMGGSPQSYYGHYYNQSPSGYSTPTSLFSGDPSSPRDPPGLQSPVSIVGRSLTWGGGRVPNRRLSVPSGPNPFQPNPAYPPPGVPYMSPPSTSGTTFSNTSSVLASPTTSVFSSDSRQTTFPSETDRKRRTWHPSTYTSYGSRPATSGLSYYQTPDAPQPVNATQPAAAQAVRLPGIDSFDRAHGQPLAPPRRLPSPMEVDLPSRRGSVHEHRRHRDSWGSMDQNLNRLDLSRPPTGEHNPSHSQVHTAQHTPNSPRGPAPPPLNFTHELGSEPGPEVQEDPVTPKKKRRQAWYNGPVANSQEAQTASVIHRTSPEGSSSSDGVHTPSTASAADFYPAIRHSNGFVETHPPGAPLDEQHKPALNAHPDSTGYPLHPLGAPVSAHPPPAPQHRPTSGTDRLDALVAVATSEEQAMKP